MQKRMVWKRNWEVKKKKKKQLLKMNDTVIEVKKILRLDTVEDRISELGNLSGEIIQNTAREIKR